MPSIQSQLNTTDLLNLADLKDLIAEGKRNEAMPGLYALAAKYPQSTELQGLIRVSLNPEILFEPEIGARNQQRPILSPLHNSQPLWGASSYPPPYGYLQPDASHASGSTPLPPLYQNPRTPSGGSQFLYYVGCFVFCLVIQYLIFHINETIVNSIQQNALREAKNAYTYYGIDLAANSANSQINMVNTITWVLYFAVIIGSTIWAAFDSNKIKQEYRTKVTGNALFIVLILIWVFGFPLYLTYRRRALYSYSADLTQTQNQLPGTPTQPKNNTMVAVIMIIVVIVGVIFMIGMSILSGPQIGQIFSGVSKGIGK